MRPCCGVSGYFIKGDGRSYCIECGESQSSQMDFEDINWNGLFKEAEGLGNKTCECGSEKAGSNKHSDYCPKYEKN